jgi:hypothetical protein
VTVTPAFASITGTPTTLTGYGITDAQPLDADLTAVAAQTGTGLLIRSGAGTATTRTVVAGTGMTVSNGDGLAGNPTVILANTAVTPGTYGSVTVYPVITVNAQGQLTAVTTQAVPGGNLMAKTTGSLTNTSNATYVNITGLSLTLAANTTYCVDYTFIGQSAVQTTGFTFSFNGGTLVPTLIRGYIEGSISATVTNRVNFIALGVNAAFSAVAAANTDQLMNAKLIIVVGATGGTLIPQFRSENNGTQVAIQANCLAVAAII